MRDVKKSSPGRVGRIGHANDDTSSVGRVFDVLDLFSVGRPVLRIDEMGSLLGYTRSTCYRYVKALATAGLVAPAGGGYYAVGARAIELDRLLQLTDPLLHAGQHVMPALRSADPDSAFLLCTLYGGKVLCIHHEGPSTLEDGGRKVDISRPRGSAFPLFSGAASLVILAGLSGHRIKSLYLRHQAVIVESGLALDWQAFRRALTDIRRQGHAYSTGTFNPYLGGLAVPVVGVGSGEVLGSLTQVKSRARFDAGARSAAARKLAAAAERIAGQLWSPMRKALKSSGGAIAGRRRPARIAGPHARLARRSPHHHREGS